MEEMRCVDESVRFTNEKMRVLNEENMQTYQIEQSSFASD